MGFQELFKWPRHEPYSENPYHILSIILEAIRNTEQQQVTTIAIYWAPVILPPLCWIFTQCISYNLNNSSPILHMKRLKLTELK